MSQIFIETLDGELNHTYGFCKLIKEFYDNIDFDDRGVDINCIGYNERSNNYYVYLDCGISFYWNEMTQEQGFITSNSENGEEYKWDNYEDAMSDISY